MMVRLSLVSCLLKKNIKIYIKICIKIYIKTAPTLFGVTNTIIRERINLCLLSKHKLMRSMLMV